MGTTGEFLPEGADLLDLFLYDAGDSPGFLEPVLAFLANPWKLWDSGNIHLRRIVLKLAFAGRLRYCRIKGPRTPKITLPFKALGV